MLRFGLVLAAARGIRTCLVAAVDQILARENKELARSTRSQIVLMLRLSSGMCPEIPAKMSRSHMVELS